MKSEGCAGALKVNDNEQSKTNNGFLAWFVVLGLIGFVIYFPGTRIDYYADDFQWYFDPPPASIFHYFLHENPNITNAYRPLQSSFLVAVQRSFGLDTLPIHLTQIALHIALSWLIYRWMVGYGFARWQAMLGSLFMLVSQANVMAVLSNDTLSQVCGPLFGGISLWLLHRSFGESRDGPRQGVTNLGYYALSVGAFAASLLSKETSASFFVMVLCIILLKNAAIKHWSLQLRRALVEIAPYVVVLALYVGTRWALGLQRPAFHSGRYGLHIGSNIVKNFAMFAFQAVLPASSVKAFAALKHGELILLGVMAGGSLLFAVAVAYGLWHSRHRGLLALLGVFAVIGLFPVVLMNKVSELYLYNSMPFISILVGAGLGKLIELSGANRLKRIAVVLFAGFLLASHVSAVQSKARSMRDAGAQSTLLLSRIEPYLERVPQNGQLLLLNPAIDQVEYSVFVMSGFNVLNTGLHRINEISRRADFDVKLIQQAELPSGESAVPGALVLALDKETQRVYPVRYSEETSNK